MPSRDLDVAGKHKSDSLANISRVYTGMPLRFVISSFCDSVNPMRYHVIPSFIGISFIT
jgi:hypothetical protein